MKRWSLLLGLALIVLMGCSTDGCTDPVVVQPPAVTPAEPEPAPIETVADLLAAMEKAGEDYPALSAMIDYTVDQRMTGDKEHRTGTIRYDAGSDETPPRFYVGFDQLGLGDGPMRAQRVEYGFDGYWLTVAKHAIKQMTRYEVVQKGERVDVFKLGKGPFPLPFGQSVEAINEFFDVEMLPAAADAPVNTYVLAMPPKPDKVEELNYSHLVMWVDKDSFLPVKIQSRGTNRDITTVVFDDIDTTYAPADRDFLLPRQSGWTYSTEPLDS